MAVDNDDDKNNGADQAAQSPEDLASTLLTGRFKGDEIATARYLLNAINSLPNATETKRIVLHGGVDPNSANDTAEEPTSPDAVDIGDILVEKVAVSCTQPRGKLDMTVGTSAILFSKDNATLFTVQGAVSHCIFFPKPSDCRKRYKIGAKLPQEMVLLVLTEEVTFKKKSYSQLCFQLPASTTPEDSAGNTSWSERLQSIFDIGTIERVLLRDNPVFRSYQDDRTSSTSAGLPFVDCYHNVADGCLYLLKAGIFFFGSGMRFVPRSTLNSIEAVALNRYATLSVTLDKTDDGDDDEGSGEDDDDNRATAGDQLEFTNIHKDEKDGIQKYIHRTLIPAMKKDAEEDDDAEDQQDEARIVATGDDDDDEEDDDEDHEDFTSPRRKRKAANEARSMNKRAMVSSNKSQDDEEDDEEEDAADQSYDEGDENSDDEGGDTEDDEGSDAQYEDL